MRWEDERYVRLYSRDTITWLSLTFEAQGLLALLLRKMDRAGLLRLGPRGVRGVAAAIGHATRWPVIEPALRELLVEGIFTVTGEGPDTSLVMPNFLEAQEARASDAARQRDRRERERDKALAASLTAPRDTTPESRDEIPESVTVRDEVSRCVTQPPGNVTPECASVTQPPVVVTPSLAVPSLAVPSRAVPCLAESLPSEGDAGAPRGEVLELKPTEPPGKKQRRPSFAESLYAKCEEARREACEAVGAEDVPEGWPPSRQNKQLGFLAKARPEERARFEDALGAYLGDAANAARDPPFSLSFFLASRSTWESRAKRAAGGVP